MKCPNKANHQTEGYPCRICGELTCPDCDTYYYPTAKGYYANPNTIIRLAGTLDGYVAHKYCAKRRRKIG